MKGKRFFTHPSVFQSPITYVSIYLHLFSKQHSDQYDAMQVDFAPADHMEVDEDHMDIDEKQVGLGEDSMDVDDVSDEDTEDLMDVCQIDMDVD